ncbi:metal-dependent hydrolase [Halomicroarcula sp. GCM10025324]|uniref:metal-dependent hydrolase n=1 Tax=Haloarcula TaxID=2237 RepID=UPI0023E88301|nr:metal-dependent hydrolase [Halomicroarcula sp. ZS-22-S1]
MLFPTHLAVAALLGRWSRFSSAWLVAGAALPDLVDKPLGMLGVFDLFQTVGHSALTLAVLAVPLARHSRAGRALVVGWVSHLLLDAVHMVVNGRPEHTVFLAWPLAVPASPLTLPPVEFFFYYLWTPSFYLEVGIWLAVVAAFVPALRTRLDGWREAH